MADNETSMLALQHDEQILHSNLYTAISAVPIGAN